MGGENGWSIAPAGVPPLMVQREEERWRHLDNSVNAVSFGFVATAILISMFLVMAIFERFLRPGSTDGRGARRNAAAAAAPDLESGMEAPAKVGFQSPNTSIYAKGVSVLMPGQNIPTFIAHPAPTPCPPERIAWPHHQHSPFNRAASSTQ